MHLIWAGLILGIAAVYGVPIVSLIINKIVGGVSATYGPKVAAYLPSSTVPGLSLAIVFQLLVYGVLLISVLHILSMVGLHARTGRA